MFEFDRESAAHIPEPDLVPILDGLVSVIFFLLLSISFIGLTKVTVPPSSSTVVSSENAKIPLSPKLTAKILDEKIRMDLDWIGPKPDRLFIETDRIERNLVNKEYIEKVRQMVKEFKLRYPAENTLQLALDRDLSYQEMISIMDGARESMGDLVLNSYEEVQ